MELINNNLYLYKNKIFPSNTYFYLTGNGNNCILIDPGLDNDILLQSAENIGLIPIAIIATHGHFDHIGSAYYFQQKYQAPFYLHSLDLKLVKAANFFLKVAKIDYQISTPFPDNLLTEHKTELPIDGVDVLIQHSPGHSVGSCVIQIKDYLFSGDTLYKKGMGFNNFPGENKEQLKSSIHQVLDNFSDDLLVLPGHGESEYLKNIKLNNVELVNFLS